MSRDETQITIEALLFRGETSMDWSEDSFLNLEAIIRGLEINVEKFPISITFGSGKGTSRGCGWGYGNGRGIGNEEGMGFG